jgi:coproporphyrinogen III oxidase
MNTLHTTIPTKETIINWFKQLQADICEGLEQLDGVGTFGADHWEREEGGGGCTKVINGAIIEKGGVAFSAVDGKAGAKMLKTLQIDSITEAENTTFLATGVSIVLHPLNPLSPIIHMNIRYFELSDGTYWFGGGIDLSPHYIDKKLAIDFHTQLKKACDAHNSGFYPRFKQWADEYFYLTHRKETRGVGGIFFDRLNEHSCTLNKSEIWAFVQHIGLTFLAAYQQQIHATAHLPYNQNHLNWQKLRRGRYVEFNLVWDRGTHFGLHTNGRTESILMSMPPQADWIYDYKPAPTSEEAQTLYLLQNPQHWI